MKVLVLSQDKEDLKLWKGRGYEVIDWRWMDGDYSALAEDADFVAVEEDWEEFFVFLNLVACALTSSSTFFVPVRGPADRIPIAEILDKLIAAKRFSKKNTGSDPAIDEARRLVLVGGDRHEDYGHPLDDFTAVTEAMNALGFRRLNRDGTVRKLEPSDHPITMICVKLAREWEKHHRDNVVDLIGYGQTLDMVLEEQERRAANA